MAYKRTSPQPVVEGGTGSTTYTAGSVVFSNGSILTQDNSNFFWDDTNNRLGIGITTPLDDFHVVGAVEFDHTAIADDDHALEITCDAAGFGDVKALDIDYITGALAAGDDEEVMLVNIDESLSTGGNVAGYQVLSTEEGSATINGYTTGININPILHNAGTFGDADDILNKAVDVTAALASGGAGSITAFVLNSETMTFGDAAQFNEMEIILGTEAGGAGIAPTFEFSTGGVGFTTFVPADGTNGLRNSGAILWVAADLVGWVANATGFLEVRMTRNRVTLPVIPILDEVQIVSATEFTWDKAGDLIVNSIALSTVLSVANGGTGLATITDGGIMLGSGTSAITPTAQPTNGQILVGSTAADPVLASLTSTGSSITVTEGAGTLNIDLAAPVSVANGGTGATTLTGVLTGNGTSAFTASAVTDNTVVMGSTSNLLQDTTITVTDAGEMVNASQPAFLAYVDTTITNVTGDGTVYTIIFDTEVFDQNADFALATSIFTAPVTGKYFFQLHVVMQGGTDITAATSRITTSNNTILDYGQPLIGSTAFAQAHLTCLMDMDTSDTATFQIITTDTGGKVDDVSGAGAQFQNYVSGYLSC